MPISSAKLTSKGQVTVPSDIRAGLGLQRGDTIDFVLLPGNRAEIRARTASAAGLRGALRQEKMGLTDADHAAAISKAVRRRHARSAEKG